MTTFDERQNAHEKKHALDEEKKFRVAARRNKMLGHWAANLMGYDVAKADAYAKEVVASDFEEAGDDDVLRKLQGDLKAAGVVVIEKDLRIKMDAFYHEALESIEAGQ